MSHLFSPLKIRAIELKNRITVSPMCQYSSKNGFPTDWHLVHLGSYAVGGAGLILTEATAVSPEGRISSDDAGIWNNEQANAYKKITAFIKSQNSIPGIQLAHAGRKASTYSPWKGTGEVKIENGGWLTLAPSPIPFADNFPLPKEMNENDIKLVINQFADAAKRSVDAGFEVIELHFAHGYLVHEFLSPLSNKRTDQYGGNLQNRCRFTIELAKSVRKIIPDGTPLFVRISSTDWVEGGWDIDQSIQLAKWLKDIGVDLIDCSSGGNISNAKIPIGPGYQIPFAEKIKNQANIITGGVGLITTAEQAEQIINSAQADIVLLAREMLRDPYWALHAAKKLNVDLEDYPKQYLRSK
ncbi:MAG: NADH:flavin oxidoreductase/NADH oxidase [Ignavibacteriales bacterium]|nr:NADH:flavin oxidoreductase/NADH oxidase [Ignavibacteriales bacterium]